MKPFLAATACALVLAAPAYAADLNATSANLLSVLQGAQPGDNVLLATGAYGAVPISGLSFAGAVVTLKPAPGAAPVFHGFDIENAAGIEIDGVTVNPNGAADIGVKIVSSSNIKLSGLTVHGVSGADEGQGVVISNSIAVTVTGSDFSAIGSGIGHSNVGGLTITNNHLHNLEADGIYGGGSSHVLVSANRLEDFHPGGGDHPDAIQFFGYYATGAPGNDVAITDNIVTRGSGDPIQCIFIEHTDNLHIAGNGCAGTMVNGIALSTVNTALVENNYVQGFTDQWSKMITRGLSANVTMKNNTAERVENYEGDGGPNPGYVESGTVIIGETAPGDYSQFNAWLANHGATPVPPPPPVVVPPPVLPPSPPTVDPRDVQIADLTAKLAADDGQVATLTGQLATETATANASASQVITLTAQVATQTKAANDNAAKASAAALSAAAATAKATRYLSGINLVISRGTAANIKRQGPTKADMNGVLSAARAVLP